MGWQDSGLRIWGFEAANLESEGLGIWCLKVQGLIVSKIDDLDI